MVSLLFNVDAVHNAQFMENKNEPLLSDIHNV